ncbi:MAG: hypothetical protein K2L01_05080 [Rikenellaceae bacterium]|nr:hypothetical protein [Rikenellaceae bacterium]
MRILKGIFTLSLLFASVSLFAQEPAASVRRVLDKFDPSRGFTVDFTVDAVSGNLTVKGDSYRITSPDAVVFGDKETKYTYVPANNEVMIDRVEPSEAAYSSPVDLFRYSASAGYKDAGTETVDGVSCRVVEVSGLDVVMYISADRLVAVKLKEDGRYHTFKPSTPRYTSLPEVRFAESDYPGVEVIDFR